MKKIFKWIGIVLISLLTVFLFFGWWINEPRPIENPTASADKLAHKMMDAVNHDAWDTTKIIQWTFNFNADHHYIWDRNRELVEVKWDNTRVLFSTNTQLGKVFIGGKEMHDDQQKDILSQAWAFFCNDSFWLNAATKVFDNGTTRSIVELKDGREALLISYSSGGVTPGDAFAWVLDDNGLPLSYKMWVNIFPIGGLEITWEDWTTLDTGAKIAQSHIGKTSKLYVKNVRGGSNLTAMNFDDDPFAIMHTEN